METIKIKLCRRSKEGTAGFDLPRQETGRQLVVLGLRWSKAMWSVPAVPFTTWCFQLVIDAVTGAR